MTVTIEQYEKLEYDLVAALADLPASQAALRPRALAALEQLRNQKRALLARSPEILRKSSTRRPQPQPAWLGLPVDNVTAKTMVAEARSRGAEQQRLAKAGSGPRRYAAPAHFRGRAVRLTSGARVDVPESGFCSPAAAAVHPGYGPAADNTVHHELVALGFRELPRNPDDATGDAAAKSSLRTALRSPVIGDRGLLNFLNQRAGR